MKPRPKDLPGARRLLDKAVTNLVEEKPHTVHRDNGRTDTVWAPSLLEQLYAAKAGQTGERSGGQSSTPVWADILDLIDKIVAKVLEWQPEGKSLCGRLRAINGRTWTVDDTPKVLAIARQLEQFATMIDAKLNPEPGVYLYAPPPSKEAAACTACDTQHVWRKDSGDNNRPVRQPALKVTAYGCVCQNCGASWEPGRLRLLAAALGYPLPAGVLE